MSNKQQIINKCTIGKNTKVYNFVNLYGCTIGNNCKIGSFTEIQQGVIIGSNVKIQSHTFICEGVTVKDDAFIGHHVVFTNDAYPRSTIKGGNLKKQGDWALLKSVVKAGASIGSNATILPGVIIGEHAMVGAGSVVVKNVAAYSTVVGNPAKAVRKT